MSRSDRAQSAVVGVAVLLALTVVSVAVLTAGAGTVVDDAAAGADAARVADRLAERYRPARVVGTRTVDLTVTGGTLRTVPREVALRRGNDTVVAPRTAALRFDRDGATVRALGRAVVRGDRDGALAVREPEAVRRVVADGRTTLVVSLVALAGTVDRTLGESERLRLAVTASHVRARPPAGNYTLRVETATPGPWRRHLADRARSVRVVDRDGDGVPSVVAELGPADEVLVVVHRLEVTVRG